MKKIALILFMLMILVPAALAVGVTRSISGNVVTYTMTGFSGVYGVLIDETITGGCTLSDGTTRYATIIMNPETTRSVTITVPSGASCVIQGSWDYGTTASGTFVAASIGTGGCTSNCANKCGGVSDGCTGTCNAVCGDACISGTLSNCMDGTCAGTKTCKADNTWGLCVKNSATCGTVICTEGATKACTEGKCPGLQTCANNAWGTTCVKTNSSCKDSLCDKMTWAKPISEKSYCLVGIGIIIIGLFAAFAVIFR